MTATERVQGADGFVRQFADGRGEVWHRDGVPWHKAPVSYTRSRLLRRNVHRHSTQTKGWFNWLNYVERCACGAVRQSKNGRWRLLDKPRR